MAQNAQEAPSWHDFCQSLTAGKMDNSVLLDYSYAGYHFSEEQLPDVSKWHTISVVDYGAIPNDNNFDDSAIQSAIDAGEAFNKPTVIYFPAGKYLVGGEDFKNTPIQVNKSHIVLKGAGSGSNGSIIHAVNFGDTSMKWHTPWRLSFGPLKEIEDERPLLIAKISKKIKRGDKTINVKNSRDIKSGMWVTLIHKQLPEQDKNFSKVVWNTQWDKIDRRGIEIEEIHLVTKVDGNQITFKNPVNYNIGQPNQSTTLNAFRSIEEIGVEDFLFTSEWLNYPEEFVHHANDVVDYAWRALFFTNIKNGWVRNVKFSDWNDCIQIRKSVTMTIDSVEISGKRGHGSFMALSSTGILIKNAVDLVPAKVYANGGQRHGPALQSGSTGCVYQNIKMQKNQSIDCHGDYPYGNLMDNVHGGTFHQNGGSKLAYPNSGPDLVLWNFKHDSNFDKIQFDFWDLNKHQLHTYLKPKFIGFTSLDDKITFENEGLDEIHGVEAYPKSLFQAQLQLRLYTVYASASSEETGFEAINLVNNDPDDFWSPKGEPIGNFIMLDFGQEKELSSFRLKDDNNAILKISFQYWSEGGWIRDKLISKGLAEGVWNLQKRIKTRKIKVLIEEVETNAMIKITEFKII
tara:strand:+ start:49548 stop:51431 length:1884 start_codon:yes stop_codon:yes gene_type:complete